MRFKEEVVKIKCERCGFIWQPRNPDDVRICPECKSARYDTLKKKNENK